MKLGILLGTLLVTSQSFATIYACEAGAKSLQSDQKTYTYLYDDPKNVSLGQAETNGLKYEISTNSEKKLVVTITDLKSKVSASSTSGDVKLSGVLVGQDAYISKCEIFRP